MIMMNVVLVFVVFVDVVVMIVDVLVDVVGVFVMIGVFVMVTNRMVTCKRNIMDFLNKV